MTVRACVCGLLHIDSIALDASDRPTDRPRPLTRPPSLPFPSLSSTSSLSSACSSPRETTRVHSRTNARTLDAAESISGLPSRRWIDDDDGGGSGSEDQSGGLHRSRWWSEQAVDVAAVDVDVDVDIDASRRPRPLQGGPFRLVSPSLPLSLSQRPLSSHHPLGVSLVSPSLSAAPRACVRAYVRASRS